MTWWTAVLLFIGWLLWLMPFFLAQRQHSSRRARVLDRRARWGIVTQGVSFAIVWQNNFWERPAEIWRVMLGFAFLAIAIALSWSATRALGRQWRLDAGLNADHELVRSGVYRVVRHPIYASMLCMLLCTGFLVATWPLLIAAVIVFCIGTEIRVRIEDRLLASQFGENFQQYARSTPAYVPLIR